MNITRPSRDVGRGRVGASNLENLSTIFGGKSVDEERLGRGLPRATRVRLVAAILATISLVGSSSVTGVVMRV